MQTFVSRGQANVDNSARYEADDVIVEKKTASTISCNLNGSSSSNISTKIVVLNRVRSGDETGCTRVDCHQPPTNDGDDARR